MAVNLGGHGGDVQLENVENCGGRISCLDETSEIVGIGVVPGLR
jgi:hypothetical protein